MHINLIATEEVIAVLTFIHNTSVTSNYECTLREIDNTVMRGMLLFRRMEVQQTGVNCFVSFLII